ncbi:MAG: hypothetical protein M1812_004420 [Candelaria pacifica]|nr:MAG: hypothetical protein M1812_004420 [Candelaria pacifica]
MAHGIGNRSSTDGSREAAGEDETVVEPDQGNVLSHIISQLRPGADLSRVVLPTFILEPRSMLERITNFMAHPETLLPIPEVEDPVDRFVSVVKFYLSGWHIKPPGVKKPLNPVLGETFTGYWDYNDGTRGYYISEQTSHHPPKSSYFFMAPEHQIRIDGALVPRSKFLGNSAASMMEGVAILSLLNRGKGRGGERYLLTQPNMYARGILFGKMKYELGDHSIVRCPGNNLVADIEFKTKGYFGGTYNAIGGVIRNEKTQTVLFELSGMWSGEMFIKDVTTGHKEVLFDATYARHTPPVVRPLEEQDEGESQKLWHKTVLAIKDQNHNLATDEKTAVEDRQREETAKRAEHGVEWHPKLFRKVQGGPGGPEEGEEELDWILDANINGRTPQAISEQILAITPILKGQPRSKKSEPPSEAQNGMSHPQPPPDTTTHPETTTHNGGDLIDFGQVVPANGPLLHAPPPSAPVAPSQPFQPTFQETPAPHSNMTPGLQQPLQPQMRDMLDDKVVRQDTKEGSVDEFVDADDGLLH